MVSKKFLTYLTVTLFWVTVWCVLAWFLPDVLFASPLETIKSLCKQGQTATFWLSIFHSLSKIALGFVIAFVSGLLCAMVSYRISPVRILLEPAIQMMKAVPVACFIVVALIWIRAPSISILVSFFVVFPISYLQLLHGLCQIDKQKIEMALVFRVPTYKKMKMLYFPQVLPSLLTACRLGVGMAWKAGIAGEIIGLPDFSIGEQLYLSKLYLNIQDLFAWTVVIILISLLCEKFFVFVLQRFENAWRTSK